MNPLSEESKKRLTKFLDGCAHIWVRDGHVSHHTCSECGEELSVRKEFLPKMRSFTTWQDLGDVKEALVKKGMWEKFWRFAWDKWSPIKNLSYSLDFTAWLFCPTDENGEAHFCRLVCSYLEEKK